LDTESSRITGRENGFMEKNVNGIGMLQLFADFSARGKRTISELVKRDDFEYLVSDPIVFTTFVNARLEERFIRIRHNKEANQDTSLGNPHVFDVVPTVTPGIEKAFFTTDAIGILSWLEGAICVSSILGGAISELNDLDVIGKVE
jgi:hypothetical protein